MNRALLFVVALTACSSRETPAHDQAPTPVVVAIDAAVAPVVNPDAKLLASNKQLVTAIVDDWDATKATMQRWSRVDGKWTSDGTTWPAVIGANGSGWGSGLHGVGAPAGRTGPIKKEGDKKNPAGAFTLRSAFGYAATPPPSTKQPYQQMTDAWKCVDDPSSQRYNQLLDETTVTKDWSSAEEMHRNDVLYTWGVEVAHNAQNTPGNGSCIFLHVWKSPEGKTVGCTAMAEENLVSVLTSLDPAMQPAFVLLPRAEYVALEDAWGLPPL
ncbi:MAG TPA: L,D-transpeptidase family protein [Kofleriaceae bacterium]